MLMQRAFHLCGHKNQHGLLKLPLGLYFCTTSISIASSALLALAGATTGLTC